LTYAYQKLEKQVINYNHFRAKRTKKLVNFGRLTKKWARMLSYPTSTLRVLCRLTRLRSCHVTLLEVEFLSPKLSAMKLTAPSGLTFGFAPKFSQTLPHRPNRKVCSIL